MRPCCQHASAQPLSVEIAESQEVRSGPVLILLLASCLSSQREPGDLGWGWLPGSCADDERQAAVQLLFSLKPWPSTQHLIPQEWVGVTLRWTAVLNFPLRNGPTGSAGQDVSLNTLISKEMSEDICFRNGNNTRR